MSELERMREVKQLMAGIEGRLANDDVFSMRRTLDDVVLAMNLLVGLVEGHRHHYYETNMCDPYMTGPMQAVEGRAVTARSKDWQ